MCDLSKNNNFSVIRMIFIHISRVSFVLQENMFIASTFKLLAWHICIIIKFNYYATYNNNSDILYTIYNFIKKIFLT